MKCQHCLKEVEKLKKFESMDLCEPCYLLACTVKTHMFHIMKKVKERQTIKIFTLT